MITERSAELNELMAALSKVQGKVQVAKKDKAGYKNNYKFAELPQYIELSQSLVEENGLSILQLPGEIEMIEIDQREQSEVTRPDRSRETNVSFHRIKIPKQSIDMWIGHTSGQYIAFKMDIIVEKQAGMSWGQSTGSAITYARKYGRAGSLAMSQEDDDNQNVKRDNSGNVKQLTPPQQRSLPSPHQSSVANSNIKATKEQIDELLLEINNDEDKIKKLLQWDKIQSIYDLSFDKFLATMEKIKNDKITARMQGYDPSFDNSSGDIDGNINHIQITGRTA